MISYTVICEFDDPEVAEQWIAWLEDEHLAVRPRFRCC